MVALFVLCLCHLVDVCVLCFFIAVLLVGRPFLIVVFHGLTQLFSGVKISDKQFLLPLPTLPRTI